MRVSHDCGSESLKFYLLSCALDGRPAIILEVREDINNGVRGVGLERLL